MKKITIIGKCGSQYHDRKPQSPSCACTMVVRFSDPVDSNTPMMIRPMETS